LFWVPAERLGVWLGEQRSEPHAAKRCEGDRRQRNSEPVDVSDNMEHDSSSLAMIVQAPS
jgi:hypothetical protein